MFDFNKGASKSATDMRALPFSDRLNILIDAGVVDARKDEKARPYIGASSIGRDCLRETQLNYIMETDPGFKKRPEEFDTKLLKIFDNGHSIEAMVARWMQSAGIELSIEKSPGEQHGFHVKEIDFKGHYDGIITKSAAGLEVPALWECKGVNANSWAAFVKQGVKAKSRTYYAQIQVNQMHSGMTAPAVFTVYNKNTSELYHELVEHSPKHAQAFTNDAKMIHQATKMGRLIKRPYSSPTTFICRFCRWNKSCWAMKR